MSEDLVVIANRLIADTSNISDSTRKAYGRDLDRLSKVGANVGTKATHYRLRAVLCWYHKESIREILAEGAATDLPDDQWRGRLQQHVDCLVSLRPGQPVDVSPNQNGNRQSGYQGRKCPVKSKRRGLGSLQADWREQILALASSDEQLPLLVLLLTGLRPGELARGVQVKVDQEGLTLTIQGNKITAQHGQPERLLLIDPSHPWGLALSGHLTGVNQQRLIAIDCAPLARLIAKLAHRFATRFPGSASAGAYRISPYSFRHQLASDLKATCTPAQTIAAILGHRSDRTQACYGQWKQGRVDGSGAIVRVTASYAPRKHGATFAASKKEATHRIVTVLSAVPAEVTPLSGIVSQTSHKPVTQLLRARPAPGAFQP